MDISALEFSNHTCTEVPVHNHEYWEILYAAQGGSSLNVENTVYRLTPGDIAIIPPGVSHGRISDDVFTDSCMFFRVLIPNGKASFRILHDDERHSVAKLMEIANIYRKPANVHEEAVLHAVEDLLYQTLVVQYITEKPMDHKLRQVIADMHDNISNPEFDLSASIAASGYCTGYFRRLFKASTNQSPVEYMQALRINYAQSLITQYGSSRSLKEIAKNSGFTDPLYFSRVFKKVTGISPKQYGQAQLSHEVDTHL